MKRRNRRTIVQKSEKTLIGEASTVGSATKIDGPSIGTPAALYEAGLAHMQAGRYLDAQLCCRKAIALDADHADALHLMGLLSFQAEHYDHAVEWMARAIRQNPKPDYLSNLGTTLGRLGRHEEALEAVDKAVQFNPNDAGLWSKLGDVLVDLERLMDALLSYQHALTLNQRHWDAAHGSGTVLRRLGRFEEAIKHFDLCREMRPDHAVTWQLRGLAQAGLKRFEEFLADSQVAHVLDPNNPETHYNIGYALHSLGRNDEALPWLERSLELRPDAAATASVKGAALAELRRFDEAFAAYHRARALDPNYAVAEWNLALLQMMIGDFEAGWAGREARWKIPSLSAGYYPAFSQPAWFGGDPIAGKTILICSDEGLGDAIQFARYVPMVAARGARVILVVPDPLCTLLSGLTGVSDCLPKSATTLPAFDFHCPLSRLPLIFGTRLDTIPAGTSCLPRPATGRVQAWDQRLGPHARLRVGLVWSGRPTHIDDRNRSIPLRMLSRILDIDATFVSLQKDPRPDDAVVLRERSGIIDLTTDLIDFAETAALVCCLDLVITVDTSVAHLAGALGRPTWILLPYTPDYRWLLDRDDSPWYPSVRLFRQNKSRDYESMLDRVRDELRARIAEFRSAEEPSSAST
jgi:tetratricopeptide (TPR) repeat protein